MKDSFDWKKWRAEAAGWTLRAALCGAPGFVYAYRAGFDGWDEVCGMLAAIFFWAAALAFYCAGQASAGPDRPLTTRAVKAAAWLKGVSFPFGWLLAKAGSRSYGLLLGPDVFAGQTALDAVQSLTRRLHLGGSVEALTSLRWTGLTALLAGSLLVMLVLALAPPCAAIFWARDRMLARRLGKFSGVG